MRLLVASAKDFERAAPAVTTEDLGPFWTEHRILWPTAGGRGGARTVRR
ncbi:hypothetical protein [Streptomyces sp. NPDC093089]